MSASVTFVTFGDLTPAGVKPDVVHMAGVCYDCNMKKTLAAIVGSVALLSGCAGGEVTPAAETPTATEAPVVLTSDSGLTEDEHREVFFEVWDKRSATEQAAMCADVRTNTDEVLVGLLSGTDDTVSATWTFNMFVEICE